MDTKICFITAIYGNYETTCKKFIDQSVPTDFICFTDNPNIISNGWIIDTTPYHLENMSPIDNHNFINSFTNNKHSFNKAKYYKQAFQNIPRLKQYDVIIWLDGTIEITNSKTSEWILSKIYTHKIIGWNHEWRNGVLLGEVLESRESERYSSTFWNNQEQPVQDVVRQYNAYIDEGFDNLYFIKKYPERKPFGVWITCFVAFLNKDEFVTRFLNNWYLQTLLFTTEDQIGFPFVCQKMDFAPYTLPDNEIQGLEPHIKTDFYSKYDHGL
jgi:hypothetical protein